MSYCRDETGKDQIIFASKEDLEKPSTALIKVDEEEDEPGLILPNGEINWNCPCLGGLATGPCGVDFREAFSCFHYSKADPKGSDCYEEFRQMQECMQKFPDLYPSNNNEEDNNLMEDIENNDVNNKVEQVEKKPDPS